jgi:SAM-dependent methyltransferase
MVARTDDGSAGDANYGVIGRGYISYRQPEPAIAARIEQALGHARSVLNVGAGAGSYEPLDRDVTAIEPSASMRAQRPAHRVVARDGVAEDLPFPDAHFDASMTTFSIHQWTNPEAGLREMRRVTRGPVLILTCDPELVPRFWLNDYAPEMVAVEARRYPAFDRIAAALGGTTIDHPVPIPLDCKDGFNEAYYGRPECLLDEGARRANSAWSFVDRETDALSVDRLRRDLEDGTWDARHGHLRTQPEFDGALRLIVSV